LLRNKHKPSELEQLTRQVDGDPIPPTINEAYHAHVAKQQGQPIPRAEPKRKQYTAPGPDPFPRQDFDAGEYNRRTKNDQPAITSDEEKRLAEAFDKLSPDEAALMYQYWGTYGEDSE